MIGFGPSSISRFPIGLIQNEIATARYSTAISKGMFAFAKGLELSLDDIIGGWIVERLMCDFTFSHAKFVSKFGAEAES